MSIDDLIDSLPGYANDLKWNYSRLVRQNADLTAQQLWGTLAASALATRCSGLAESVLDEAVRHLSRQALEGARSAAAIASAGNLYYGLRSVPSGAESAGPPPKPRMNLLRRRAVSKADFELWSVAVSTVNGCAKCIVEHERAAREKGVSDAAVLAAVRIASVLHAMGGVMEAERGAAIA